MEEDLNYNGQTTKLPRRRHWYTRLWSSCLGCSCMKHQKKKIFVVYHNGYDPVGPLQRAATVGDLDTLERLIHSSEHHVDESDRRGRTSMHYACAHNHPEAVILLLENASNINIQDDEGSTPLIKATQQENVDCVSLLLSHNADPNLIDVNGNTAFLHAVSRGNIPIVKMLLEHNVDFEAKNRFGITPVELAAFNNKPEMVKFLETYYANARAMLNRTVVRAPDVLLAPRMLLLLLMPLIISNTSPWFLIFLLAVVTWMRNPFQQVWHEENGHGPPTNKTDEPVAAAADQYSLKKGSRPTV
uniref:ankyrin repeat domain-containing protein 7-like n=1 Tax=Arvicanthis niloticus TaxID=61156 RepID=UPI0014873D70|nr:ankyrin repeat domain-containing protein 7-like [Arvicanthis niloticus]